ncbi:MAG: hypothetical protein KAS32_23580 [Candidatus Peribacteraceae bacterium]|nr:hypothetical protein [Candidatus Peribacteraceae bacterium]
MEQDKPTAVVIIQLDGRRRTDYFPNTVIATKAAKMVESVGGEVVSITDVSKYTEQWQD